MTSKLMTRWYTQTETHYIASPSETTRKEEQNQTHDTHDTYNKMYLRHLVALLVVRVCHSLDRPMHCKEPIVVPRFPPQRSCPPQFRQQLDFFSMAGAARVKRAHVDSQRPCSVRVDVMRMVLTIQRSSEWCHSRHRLDRLIGDAGTCAGLVVPLGFQTYRERGDRLRLEAFN